MSRPETFGMTLVYNDGQGDPSGVEGQRPYSWRSKEKPPSEFESILAIICSISAKIFHL